MQDISGVVIHVAYWYNNSGHMFSRFYLVVVDVLTDSCFFSDVLLQGQDPCRWQLAVSTCILSCYVINVFTNDFFE